VAMMVRGRGLLHDDGENRKGKKRMGLVDFERTKNNAPVGRK